MADNNKNNMLIHIPVALTLFLASTNKDFDRYLDTLASVVTRTREAVQSIRQGVQTIQQVEAPKTGMPEVQPLPVKNANDDVISLMVNTKEDDRP
ncbi:MAG: hypothetical protein AB1500_12065 [Bacillota bacterium]